MALDPQIIAQAQRFAVRGVDIFRNVLVRLDKFVTGDTWQSVEGVVLVNGERLIIQFRAIDTFEFRIGGRGPGKPPPIDPLFEWVAEKDFDINPYALQKSIGLFGTVTKDPGFEVEFDRDIEPEIQRFLESDEVALVLLQKIDNFFSRPNP